MIRSETGERLSLKSLSPEIQALLREQKRYYDARSTEYDEWWERRGRYDLGAEGNKLWQDQIRKLEAIFDITPLGDHVLEPAAGTGNWTVYLARRAERVTVVECSQAMIELNRRRLQEAGLSHRVEYEQTDLFSWNPSGAYDSVFLGFWLSHVPFILLDSFLLSIVSALKPGGCLAILDGQRTRGLRSPHQGTQRLNDEIELRTLNDGRKFNVVKRYDEPRALESHLKQAGLIPEVGTCGDQFLYAVAHKSQPRNIAMP